MKGIACQNRDDGLVELGAVVELDEVAVRRGRRRRDRRRGRVGHRDVGVVVGDGLVAEGVDASAVYAAIAASCPTSEPMGRKWVASSTMVVGTSAARSACDSGTPLTMLPRSTRRRGPKTHGAGRRARPVRLV